MVQGAPFGHGTLFGDIKSKVWPQYELLFLNRNSYFNVNKSFTRWTTLKRNLFVLVISCFSGQQHPHTGHQRRGGEGPEAQVHRELHGHPRLRLWLREIPGMYKVKCSTVSQRIVLIILQQTCSL